MSWKNLISFALCWTLSLGGSPLIGADGPDLGQRNIRLSERVPGIYLAPKIDPAKPEIENFSTTAEPLAPLTLEGLEGFLSNNPALRDYKIVIIGPAVSGTEAEEFRSRTEEVLQLAGITPDVQVIRHPKTLKEKLLNLFPRREDYEKPTPGELGVAAGKILIAESLSFAVLLVPAVLKQNGIHVNEAVDSLVDQIALPMGVGVAMCVLDVANMIPLVSFRRALSNHNIRLSAVEKFLRQFLMGVFFSFNFNLVSQSPQIAEYVSQANIESIPKDLVASAGKMAAVVIPASVFNMFSRTTISASLNTWEQSSENRRFYTSILEAVTNILIAPVYILSTMPVLQPLVNTPFMDLNAAHLTMLGMGVAGGAAWSSLERDKLSNWFATTRTRCRDALIGMGRRFLSGQKGDRHDQPGN